MYVGSVCTHPSYNDKNPPSVFFFKSSFSNQVVLRFLSEWCSSVQAPPTRVDWQARLTLAPPSWVSWELRLWCREDKMSQIKRLKCLVDGCNNEYSSRHLLLTSELLKMQRINVTFALWMRRSPICLNAFVRANHSWSSFIYRVYGFFMNLWKSPFLIWAS